jgi:hypothetical protein
MQGTQIHDRSGSPALIGIVLVIVGVGILGLRQAGVDAAGLIADAGWPFFVILPGLVLMAAAIFPAPPAGLGFAIAGSIVTTVGLILLYQDTTDHWESWAYAWALLPTASGVATLLYGLAFRRQDLIAGGLRIVAVGVAMFLAGFWFFETIFESGRTPIDLSTWWPVIVIGLGVLITLTALVHPSRSGSGSTGDVPPLGGDRP